MRAALLSVHVLAAVLTVGPVTVAASMFPRFARAALADPASGPAARAVLAVLYRICRVYAAVGLFVPVLGLATAAELGVLGDPWVIASVALTVLAAVLLVARILPAQRLLVAGSAGPDATADDRSSARLSATTGVFALLWVTVTVLMIIRPGSTTGA